MLCICPTSEDAPAIDASFIPPTRKGFRTEQSLDGEANQNATSAMVKPLRAITVTEVY